MRTFVSKLLLFGLLFWAGDQFLTSILERFRPIDYKLFIESKSEIFHKNKNYEILFIGDSHVSDAIDTRIVDSVLHTTSFNLRVYHASPYEWFYLLRACLEHLETKPNYIIIGTNPDMFYRKKDPGKYTPLMIDSWRLQYSLYYNSSGGIDPSFFVQSLRQSDLLMAMRNKILGNVYTPTREVVSVYSGYLKTANHMADGNWEQDDFNNRHILDSQVEYLIKTMKLALESGIKVILVNEPVWHTIQTNRNRSPRFQAVQNKVREISEDLNVPVFNEDYGFGYSELKKEDFLNPTHLNGHGSRKYTGAFCDWILDYAQDVSAPSN